MLCGSHLVKDIYYTSHRHTNGVDTYAFRELLVTVPLFSCLERCLNKILEGVIKLIILSKVSFEITLSSL